LEITVTDKHVFTLDVANRIGVYFSGDCQVSVEIYLRIKRLIDALYAGAAVGIRLDIGNGSVVISTDPNRMLVFYSSAELLRIPDWIDVLHADDFRSCPNLREVIAGLQREIDGFRDCRKLERVDPSQSIEVVGRGAFRADEGGCHVFITGDESWLWRRRRGCHLLMTGKAAQKEEDRQTALSGIIAHLTAKCGGNVHKKGVVEITASSVPSSSYSPWNAADLRKVSSEFSSRNKPDQWISWDFKALRIEPTHYTIRTSKYGPNTFHLKSWAVEGSDDGASWTEIDRRENNSDLNDRSAVKTFAVSRSGSFRMIRLHQTGPTHNGNNVMNLNAFEVFGAVAGLQ
jgi:hypothetical protein